MVAWIMRPGPQPGRVAAWAQCAANRGARRWLAGCRVISALQTTRKCFDSDPGDGPSRKGIRRACGRPSLPIVRHRAWFSAGRLWRQCACDLNMCCNQAESCEALLTRVRLLALVHRPPASSRGTPKASIAHTTAQRATQSPAQPIGHSERRLHPVTLLRGSLCDHRKPTGWQWRAKLGPEPPLAAGLKAEPTARAPGSLLGPPKPRPGHRSRAPGP